MSRHKSMTKSGWKKRDKAFRDEQNARAKANRERKAIHAALQAEKASQEEKPD
jgi:hypothetical protein